MPVALHLFRRARPHIAVVGQVAGTEHFRNISCHRVMTSPAVLSIRVDESLYFANARFLEDAIHAPPVAADPAIRHVVLMCQAVKAIDASTLESLKAVNRQLADSGVLLLDNLTGRVFLTQFGALVALASEVTRAALAAPRGDSAR